MEDRDRDCNRFRAKGAGRIEIRILNTASRKQPGEQSAERERFLVKGSRFRNKSVDLI